MPVSQSTQPTLSRTESSRTQQPPNLVRTSTASSLRHFLRRSVRLSGESLLSFYPSRRRESYVLVILGLHRFRRWGQTIWEHSNSFWARCLSWVILVLLLWALLFSILDEDMAPDGDLFRLLFMIIAAYLVGRVTELCKLPGLLGMVVVGLVIRNVGFYHPAQGEYKEVTRVMKQLATTCGMVRAGLQLVPDAIFAALHCHHGYVLTGLAMAPSFLEAMVTSFIAFFGFDYPIPWALALGFLLCPNSPLVITPPMKDLMKEGYGEDKNIGVLVNGAAGLDVAFSVTLFDLCMALLLRRQHLDPIPMIKYGTLDVVVDVFGGFTLGIIAGIIPVQNNNLAVWKRTVAVMAGGMLAIVLGPGLGLPGTGPLSCIITGFVASMLWKLQVPLSTEKTVNDIIQGIWIVVCPMLFAFSGSDVDLSILKWNNISWMLGIVITTVIVRMLGCFLVLCCRGFNFKEMVFVGIIFQGKATNQAALAPQILYAAWASNAVNDMRRALESVTMGVLSILICTPISHLGAKWGGPCLLSKKIISQSRTTTIRRDGDDNDVV